jgi:hypothetical protein
MALTYYCPSCWNEARNGSDCASCGADLGQFASESYEQKLIRALRHPEPPFQSAPQRFWGYLAPKPLSNPLSRWPSRVPTRISRRPPSQR